MKFLINGEFIDKSDHYDVINPYNGEIVDTVPIGYRNDVDKAIEAANNAKKVLNDLSAKEVSINLFNACEELEKESENIAKLIVREAGKPYKQAIVELQRSVETLQFAAEEAKRIYGESVPIDATGSTDARFLAFTKKVPLGVVGTITPFNYPVNLALHKIAPAIAAKNTVVMKPSMEAPLSALRLAEIIDNHFPDGVINSVTGYGSEVGDAMVVSSDVNKISFTGSVATGLFISSRAGMKKLTLELGGNDPLVVLDDADIEKATDAAVSGAFLFSGQVCIGVKRIILDNGIADEFLDAFVKKASRLKMGNPMDESTDIGPLINESAAINVETAVNSAIDDGADLILGGNRKDCFFEPTILDNVNMSMDLVANETICEKEKFYSTPYFNELKAFLKTYKEWLTELNDNKRSLNLFNLGCGEKPFELVTDRKPQQGGLLGLGKKDYESFYDALNRAAQKVRGDKASSLFIETYSRATKKMAEDKLKM